ncbi:hypothetical protein ACCO45_009218 [Purpureocillium lilacinum]|uniref:Uncharacterized protein n=1 Tax=Purpureocillium lilacinum TaxID=33203 RepID=A0ACC4DKL1_PURLI
MPSYPPNLSIIVEPPPSHPQWAPAAQTGDQKGTPSDAVRIQWLPGLHFLCRPLLLPLPSATPPPAAAALSVSRLFRTVPLGPLQLSQSPPGETCARARDSRRRRREDANPELRQEDDPSRRYTTAQRACLDERRIRDRNLERWQERRSRTKPPAPPQARTSADCDRRN